MNKTELSQRKRSSIQAESEKVTNMVGTFLQKNIGKVPITQRKPKKVANTAATFFERGICQSNQLLERKSKKVDATVTTFLNEMDFRLNVPNLFSFNQQIIILVKKLLFY